MVMLLATDIAANAQTWSAQYIAPNSPTHFAWGEDCPFGTGATQHVDDGYCIPFTIAGEEFMEAGTQQVFGVTEIFTHVFPANGIVLPFSNTINCGTHAGQWLIETYSMQNDYAYWPVGWVPNDVHETAFANTAPGQQVGCVANIRDQYGTFTAHPDLVAWVSDPISYVQPVSAPGNIQMRIDVKQPSGRELRFFFYWEQ